MKSCPYCAPDEACGLCAGAQREIKPLSIPADRSTMTNLISLPQYRTGDVDECRTCGQTITLADDGAWEDRSGACGCGCDEHQPGGFDQYAADALARDTDWYEDPPERCAHGVALVVVCDYCDALAAR